MTNIAETREEAKVAEPPAEQAKVVEPSAEKAQVLEPPAEQAKVAEPPAEEPKKAPVKRRAAKFNNTPMASDDDTVYQKFWSGNWDGV